MNSAATQFHRLKFRLWYFSRVYPRVGQPLRWAAQHATAGFTAGYQRRLERMGAALFPLDRYERPADVPCQCVLLTDVASADDLRGLTLLLNHFRIPYHRAQVRDLPSLFASAPQPDRALLGVGETPAEGLRAASASGSTRAVGIAFGAAATPAPGLTRIDGRASDLLPSRAGLRSSPTRQFLATLLASSVPIVTGMLPPQAGMRVDDVAGRSCRVYVAEMNRRGWRPNLGIFLKDFQPYAVDAAPYLAALDLDGHVECSPHAQTAYDFLFFNYKDGEPFADARFAAMWQEALRRFRSWGLKVCPVLNAHFHAFSSATYPLLAESGVKYIFSELAPNGIGAEPAPRYLPSGDPLCTTGQLDGGGMVQIHSGDPTLCCNRPSSTYDFLMHNDAGEVPVQAGRKIAERVALSLETGFAAFATTHEYLLDPLGQADIGSMLDEADRRLRGTAVPFTRVSMSELGRACENHTNTVVTSVAPSPGGARVTMAGHSAGSAALTVLGEGRLTVHQVPAFTNGHVKELRLWD